MYVRMLIMGLGLCAVQIALDRLGYGPAFNLLMMSFVYKLSGQKWKEVWASLQKTFWSAQVPTADPSRVEACCRVRVWDVPVGLRAWPQPGLA